MSGATGMANALNSAPTKLTTYELSGTKYVFFRAYDLLSVHKRCIQARNKREMLIKTNDERLLWREQKAGVDEYFRF